MDPHKLIDAIGMVDDRFLMEEERRRSVSVRRKLVALAAAIIILALSVGSVMAVSQEFPQLGENIREAFIKIFHIETHEQPPEGELNSTVPSQSGLWEIGVVNIDGAVNAHYFAGEGYIQRFEGGFYTCSAREGDMPPAEYTFWEIRKEGIMEMGAARADFTLTYDGREFQIVFDHAVINGGLCIMVWPKEVDENPYLNGWNVQAIGDRTDVALLSVPVWIEDDITHDYFLLNMATLETVDLFEFISMDHMRVDACWITDDLNYAMVVGSDLVADRHGYWFFDLRQNTLTDIDDLLGFTASSPYFLDNSTLICEQWLGDGRISVVRWDILTGQKTVVVENVTRRSAMGGYTVISKAYGLLYGSDGSAELIDLRTGKITALTGLSLEGTAISESPKGQSILIAYRERAKDEKTSWCYPKIGLLDPENGVLKLLTRDISGNAEYLRGWLNDQIVILTSRNGDGSYYVLVYEFVE